MSNQQEQAQQYPDYANRFCPILSHAVLKPIPTKEESKLLAVGGEVKSDASEPPEAEYIGCQGPNCAFFLIGENGCCLPMLTRAMAAIISLQFGDKLNNPPQSPPPGH